MGQIRIFNGPPKAFEFDQQDLVIDNINGDIYYKDWKGNLQKIATSDNQKSNISLNSINALTQVSSTIVSASSYLIAGNITSSYHISASGDLEIRHITSSGNISASGTIIANNFQSDGQQQIAVADSFNITGSITSSGNISASGDISASNIHLPAQGKVTFASDQFITGQNNSITIDGDDTIKIKADNFVTFVDNSNTTFAAIDPNAGNITASGNISSSGALSTFGEVFHLEGTDPRLKLKAKGANHPGVEWHEDATRKWVVYNDPDERDNLTFKNDSTELVKISQTGDITASADMNVSGEIIANTGSFNVIEGGVF